MPLVLDVDGRQIVEPDKTDIAGAFASLGEPGFRQGGISLITLTRDETHSLTASGHPDEGFSLSLEDGEPDRVYNTERFLGTDEVVKIFQAYARGGNWGKDGIQWEVMELHSGTVGKWAARIALACLLAYAAYVLFKSVIQTNI
jgi:hypothetical protein